MDYIQKNVILGINHQNSKLLYII